MVEPRFETFKYQVPQEIKVILPGDKPLDNPKRSISSASWSESRNRTADLSGEWRGVWLDDFPGNVRKIEKITFTLPVRVVSSKETLKFEDILDLPETKIERDGTAFIFTEASATDNSVVVKFKVTGNAADFRGRSLDMTLVDRTGKAHFSSYGNRRTTRSNEEFSMEREFQAEKTGIDLKTLDLDLTAVYPSTYASRNLTFAFENIDLE